MPEKAALIPLITTAGPALHITVAPTRFGREVSPFRVPFEGLAFVTT